MKNVLEDILNYFKDKYVECPRCEGKGVLHGSDAGWVAETDDDAVVCFVCDGKGMIERV